MPDSESSGIPPVTGHLDPELRALLALGERAPSGEESSHLTQCAACSAEVRQLAATAAIARSAEGADELVEPPARVWAGIHSQLNLGDEPAPQQSPPLASLASGEVS